MKIKDTKLLRKLYKEKVRGYTDSNRNENFVGHSITYDNNTIYGFFEIYHGDKPDIGKFITPFLDMAQDWQAVYELIQNASDSESSYFGLFFDEHYLLAINNGKQFSFEGVRSILNIAQSPKDSKSNIGKFGVGFKIVHKLIGKSNGKNELLNYEGPIVFSWNSFKDLKDLADLNSIANIETNDFDLVKMKDTFECSNDSSWLFKILLTNFPCGINDKIYDLNYLERSNIISEKEINKLSEYINKYVFNPDHINEDNLNSGSIIFLKLGADKSKQIQQSHIGNGIDYSLNILNAIYEHSSKGIKKILINEEGFEPGNINVETFRIYPEDKE